jgi:acyl-CoA synthetase (AMP-forming)/AMP-acid ligase II/1-acyl-sn-glycerol-3-phosphate acyltransferase
MAALLCWLARRLLSLRYRVTVKGKEEVARRGTGGILFLPNHPAIIDPVLVRVLLQAPFAPHVLADKDRISGRFTAWAARVMKALPLPDPLVYGEAARGEVEAALEGCATVLRGGGNLLLYPAGRIMRSRREELGAASAVETLLRRAPDARVVLVRTTGLWGSAASRIHGRNPQLGSFLLRGLGILLQNLLLLTPRREVRLTFHEPADFPRGEGRDRQNRFLEAFYNQEAPAGRHVPYRFWEDRAGRELPDPQPPRAEGDPSQVAPEVRARVLARLRELAGKAEIQDGALLARDLGLDSLGRLELWSWLGKEFAVAGADPEALQTAGDAMLAAAGLLDLSGRSALAPIAPAWFAPRRAPAHLPPGATIAEVFLASARRQPAAAIAADQTSGVKTYRDLVTAVFALRPAVAAIPGPCVGIMLPASVGAAVAYLAVLFAGKTPVMVNWTVGGRSLRHGLELLKVAKVLTAGKLVAKVEAQGLDLSPVKDRLLPLEELGRSLGTGRKLLAALRGRLPACWSALARAEISPTAAVLFTSGSESLPKAVPLTHANLLANLRDVEEAYPFIDRCRMLGILPPFHSFGLTCTTLLPLCAGLPVAYHPNPTEGGALATLAAAYQVNLLLGTPTFLAGIARAATDEQLAGLRYVITGAEKCPESLQELLARRCPSLAVLEGYGITECSPVVSGNRLEDRRPGTIGRPLPSVRHAIVDPLTGARLPPGETGMLLLQGPSIFGGYLHHDGPSPFQELEGSRWYRTGDLVREVDGSLVFAGRLKRFVKLGGEMVSLPAVEEALLARFGRETDDEVVLAVEATPSEESPELVLFTIRDLSREEANAALRDAGLSPIHAVRRVVRLEKIPVLGTGKTDYRTLRASLK